jgi:diguanylate cyclase (GGDEF)-like protein
MSTRSHSPADFELGSEALMQFLYLAPIGLVQTLLDGSVELINPMAASLLIPVSSTGLLDNLFKALGEVAPELPALVAKFDQPSGRVIDALRVPLPAPTAAEANRFLSLSIIKVDSNRLIATLADATLEVQREQEGLARQVRKAARLDNLTQMPNRAAVRDLIQQAIDKPAAGNGWESAVIFINCDRFNNINDSLGQAAGDELLGMMAERLNSALRNHNRSNPGSDTQSLAARFGGDEFVILLGDLVHGDDVHIIAQRLLAVLGQPYGIRAHQVHCRVSMGIVLRPQMGPSADAVLQDASIAMAEAKRAGGDRYIVFEPKMEERARRRSGIETDLRQAIIDEELFVVYQPVVGLASRAGEAGVDKLAGVEALVRWHHPVRGPLLPAEFIGIAEECGLIGKLGDHVLRTACSHFVGWKTTLGTRAPRLLAVNLSRSQLSQPGFVDSVREILAGTGMVPEQLQLEVTESLAAQDEAVRARLQELKSLGLTLALDDFGTGYSSLASLHLLPVDVIKIDRSFVNEAVTSAHHRVLIEATVWVAQSLGMATVAEGIETPQQLAVVRTLGCEKGQGYLFSRPLTEEKLITWLMQSEPLESDLAVI